MAVHTHAMLASGHWPSDVAKWSPHHEELHGVTSAAAGDMSIKSEIPDGYRSREGARDVSCELRRQVPSSERPGQPAGQARQQGGGGAGAQVGCAAIGVASQNARLHPGGAAAHPGSHARPCTWRGILAVYTTWKPDVTVSAARGTTTGWRCHRNHGHCVVPQQGYISQPRSNVVDDEQQVRQLVL